MTAHSQRFFFLLLLVCFGCSASVSSGDFELGTGTWRFDSVADGDTLELVRGVQGGWHIWVSARVRNPEPGAPLDLSVSFANGDEAPLHNISLTPTFDPPNSSGYSNFLGWAAQLSDPACAVGELVRVRAVYEAGGQMFEDEYEVIVGPGTDPPGDCGGEE